MSTRQHWMFVAACVLMLVAGVAFGSLSGWLLTGAGL